MKISIITATKNSCKTLEQSLLSYIMQDYPDKELIIVDGYSTDCTLDVIKKYRQHIDVLTFEPKSGIYPALNLGIKVASGDVIGFLHSDDFFIDNKVLTDIAKMFQQGYDVVYGDVVYINSKGKIWRYWKAGKFSAKQLIFGWMPPHTTFFVKKDLYQKYGLYREDLLIAADYEMILRILTKNVCVGYVDRLLTVMRAGGKSNRSLSNILLKTKEDFYSAKINGMPALITVLAKNIRKINQFFPLKLRN